MIYNVELIYGGLFPPARRAAKHVAACLCSSIARRSCSPSCAACWPTSFATGASRRSCSIRSISAGSTLRISPRPRAPPEPTGSEPQGPRRRAWRQRRDGLRARPRSAAAPTLSARGLMGSWLAPSMTACRAIHREFEPRLMAAHQLHIDRGEQPAIEQRAVLVALGQDRRRSACTAHRGCTARPDAAAAPAPAYRPRNPSAASAATAGRARR